MILGGSSRKTRTSLQNTECRMQIQSSVQSHHLAFPIWRPSLSFHQINLSMHVFMHQSINVSAHGNIVPAHRHPRHRLGSQRARGVSLGAGAGREGRSCKIGHFFGYCWRGFPRMSARFRTAGIAQTTGPLRCCIGHTHVQIGSRRTCIMKGEKGQWTPGTGTGRKNWRWRRRAHREASDGNEMIDFIPSYPQTSRAAHSLIRCQKE